MWRKENIKKKELRVECTRNVVFMKFALLNMSTVVEKGSGWIKLSGNGKIPTSMHSNILIRISNVLFYI